MTNRSKPWEIAADLEAAAEAVRKAQLSIAAVHKSAWDEMGSVTGIWNFDADAGDIANALQALSAKYQAIADAEPDGPECPTSPTRRHIIDTSMESGPHNCFHCERSMP